MTAGSSGTNPPLPAPRGDGHLTEAEDRLLRSLIADRPAATAGQILALFRARTGRKLHRSAVYLRRHSPAPKAGHRNLSEAHRELLAHLIRENWGEAGLAEIAAAFRAAAGRPLTLYAVWHHARRLGMRRPGQGRGPRRRPEAVAARLAEESAARREAEAARLDRARVDRSPRVGRTGRLLPGGPS